MLLTRYSNRDNSRWSLNNHWLTDDFTLSDLLTISGADIFPFLKEKETHEKANGSFLAPIEDNQEVWASGVTYLRSKQAREAESATGDIYQRVYSAQRPELFYKSLGWRVIPHLGQIRVRKDSRWNVPEPELTILINCFGEIIGYTAGNDVSSRDIEGENPLYLPQAKVYKGSCALGPSIFLVQKPTDLHDIRIQLDIWRNDQLVFRGDTQTNMMKRSLEELAAYLYQELDFPQGAFLMTGTGVVPPESFSLQPGDEVHVTVGSIVLKNRVGS